MTSGEELGLAPATADFGLTLTLTPGPFPFPGSPSFPVKAGLLSFRPKDGEAPAPALALELRVWTITFGLDPSVLVLGL